MTLTKRSVQGIGAAIAAVLSMLVTAYLVLGGTEVIGGQPSPPSCTDAPGKLTTPTGRPILTVTQGANNWIANRAAEPLALAVYADGTVIGSLEIGQADKQLAPMVIGHVQTCVLQWATTQIERLATVPMGEPDITDQGTTEITYQPTVGGKRTISAYALIEDDDDVTGGRANRADLKAVISVLRQPLSSGEAWTPDRLRLVQGARDPSGDAVLSWPGSVPLAQVLTERRFTTVPCGEVSGADAAAVRSVLGDRHAYSNWTDGSGVTGLDIGVLVPGQVGCDA